MKKQLLLLSILLLIAKVDSFSQNNYCSSDERIKQAFIDNPQYKSNYLEFKKFAKKYTEETFNANEKGTVYQIPTVFHIIQSSGNQNVSDATILNTLQSMNDHWRKNLSDSSQN